MSPCDCPPVPAQEFAKQGDAKAGSGDEAGDDEAGDDEAGDDEAGDDEAGSREDEGRASAQALQGALRPVQNPSPFRPPCCHSLLPRPILGPFRRHPT